MAVANRCEIFFCGDRRRHGDEVSETSILVSDSNVQSGGNVLNRVPFSSVLYSGN